MNDRLDWTIAHGEKLTQRPTGIGMASQSRYAHAVNHVRGTRRIGGDFGTWKGFVWLEILKTQAGRSNKN